jgi:hypothetical protein
MKFWKPGDLVKATMHANDIRVLYDKEQIQVFLALLAILYRHLNTGDKQTQSRPSSAYGAPALKSSRQLRRSNKLRGGRPVRGLPSFSILFLCPTLAQSDCSYSFNPGDQIFFATFCNLSKIVSIDGGSVKNRSRSSR